MATTNQPSAAAGNALPQLPLDLRLAAAVQRMKAAGRLDEGEAACRRAMNSQPQQPASLHLLALIQAAKGDVAGAVTMMEQAVAAAPRAPVHMLSLSRLYRRLNRNNDDRRTAEKAVSLAPRNARIRAELAFANFFAGDMEAAGREFLECLKLDPTSVAAHAGLAQLLLLSGEFAPGWREYQWFQRIPEFAAKIPKFQIPQWNGMRMPQGRILLFSDQGFGDCLQFARYIPMVAERCGEVLLWSYDALGGLLSKIDGVTHYSARASDLPAANCYCLLSSLPRIFGTELDSIPANVPYLAADPSLVKRWTERFDTAVTDKGLRVGIAWAGKPSHGRDSQRSLDLAQLEPVLQVSGIVPVSLHKETNGEGAAPGLGVKILDFSGDLRDFGDTAALIQNLDLVITIDTSVAHLAGALGKPVWVILPHIPDWRWLLDREDSPWYPTARLFRQGPKRRWDEVVDRVAAELSALAGKTGKRARAKTA